jgi:ABC-type nickel/cobalt efflux system permease component RcnA
LQSERHRRLHVLVALGLLIGGGGGSVSAHDVPDRFFDRSIQVSIGSDRLSISYQLSLTQLTLAEELLSLVDAGVLARSDDSERLTRYAQGMGPLLAQGLIVKVDGTAVPVRFAAATHRVEDHPRFTFELDVPDVVQVARLRDNPTTSVPHRLSLEDTSFFLEKGCIRIAIRARELCEIVRSTVPAKLDAVTVRPSWEMTPEQQDEARRADAVWRVHSVTIDSSTDGDLPAGPDPAATANPTERSSESAAAAGGRTRGNGQGIVSLLDRGRRSFPVLLLALAFFFGAAHALTPGHGKTMVAAYLVGERGTFQHAVSLGLTTSLTHTGSVLVVAAILALISPALERKIHTGFSLLSGMLVAGLGTWLLVQRLRSMRRSASFGFTAVEAERRSCNSSADETLPGRSSRPGPRWGGLLALGISGGIVPCWDAVALVLFAAAEGQLARALSLLLSFSAGLAAALVAVGVLAVQFRGFLSSRFGSGRIVQSLPVISATAILAVGLYLCVLTLQTPGAAATLTSAVARWTAEP